ncbi:unnamed protein product [Moneuplotes crassus]|uniref:Uncharacterized protein n=1 Tax=Euplotes crassus TaxID=5936 RepID=A0AAD1X8Z1_EUPCR|nr:unnamed protein product [Moneuplotes crassus]
MEHNWYIPKEYNPTRKGKRKPRDLNLERNVLKVKNRKKCKGKSRVDCIQTSSQESLLNKTRPCIIESVEHSHTPQFIIKDQPYIKRVQRTLYDGSGSRSIVENIGPKERMKIIRYQPHPFEGRDAVPIHPPPNMDQTFSPHKRVRKGNCPYQRDGICKNESERALVRYSNLRKVPMPHFERERPHQIYNTLDSLNDENQDLQRQREPYHSLRRPCKTPFRTLNLGSIDNEKYRDKRSKTVHPKYKRHRSRKRKRRKSKKHDKHKNSQNISYRDYHAQITERSQKRRYRMRTPDEIYVEKKPQKKSKTRRKKKVKGLNPDLYKKRMHRVKTHKFEYKKPIPHIEEKNMSQLRMRDKQMQRGFRELYRSTVEALLPRKPNAMNRKHTAPLNNRRITNEQCELEETSAPSSTSEEDLHENDIRKRVNRTHQEEVSQRLKHLGDSLTNCERKFGNINRSIEHIRQSYMS